MRIGEIWIKLRISSLLFLLLLHIFTCILIYAGRVFLRMRIWVYVCLDILVIIDQMQSVSIIYVWSGVRYISVPTCTAFTPVDREMYVTC